MRSSPSPPLTSSAPHNATITSSLGVPSILSAVFVPTIVAGSPKHLCWRPAAGSGNMTTAARAGTQIRHQADFIVPAFFVSTFATTGRFGDLVRTPFSRDEHRGQGDQRLDGPVVRIRSSDPLAIRDVRML